MTKPSGVKTKENTDIEIYKSDKNYEVFFTCPRHVEESNKLKFKTVITLANVICNFPNRDLLGWAHTETLDYYWHQLRDFNCSVGAEFLTKALKFEAEVIDTSRSKNLNFQLIKFTGDRFYAMWEMIKYSFTHLKIKLKNCSPTARELFTKIVEEELNKPFEEVIYNSYVQYDVKTIGLVAAEIALGYGRPNTGVPTSNKLINNMKINTLIKPVIGFGDVNTWDEVLKILNDPNKKLAKNRLLQNTGEDFNKATRYICDIVVELSEKRTSEGLLTPSWAWVNGELVETRKH